MARYLSQEWLDAASGLRNEQSTERVGASARIQVIVSGGPDGEIAYYRIMEDGRISESQLGKLEDPELTITLGYEDAVMLQKGELDPNTAFMQGRMKASGDMSKLMQLMPFTMSSDYRTLQDQIRDLTEF